MVGAPRNPDGSLTEAGHQLVLAQMQMFGLTRVIPREGTAYDPRTLADFRSGRVADAMSPLDLIGPGILRIPASAVGSVIRNLTGREAVVIAENLATAEAAALWSPLAGKTVSQLTKAETGQIGEAIGANFLKQNGYDEVYAMVNVSGNGIDLVGRSTATGQWIAVEVKASKTGSIAELSFEQVKATEFISTRLQRATTETWGLQGGPMVEAFARQARIAWQENPSSFQRIAIGVDLRSQILRISQWR